MNWETKADACWIIKTVLWSRRRQSSSAPTTEMERRWRKNEELNRPKMDIGDEIETKDWRDRGKKRNFWDKFGAFFFFLVMDLLGLGTIRLSVKTLGGKEFDDEFLNCIRLAWRRLSSLRYLHSLFCKNKE